MPDVTGEPESSDHIGTANKMKWGRTEVRCTSLKPEEDLSSPGRNCREQFQQAVEGGGHSKERIIYCFLRDDLGSGQYPGEGSTTVKCR